MYFLLSDISFKWQFLSGFLCLLCYLITAIAIPPNTGSLLLREELNIKIILRRPFGWFVVMVLCVIGSDILTVSDGININISGLECAQPPLNAPRPVKLIVNTVLRSSLAN